MKSHLAGNRSKGNSEPPSLNGAMAVQLPASGADMQGKLSPCRAFLTRGEGLSRRPPATHLHHEAHSWLPHSQGQMPLWAPADKRQLKLSQLVPQPLPAERPPPTWCCPQSRERTDKNVTPICAWAPSNSCQQMHSFHTCPSA